MQQTLITIGIWLAATALLNLLAHRSQVDAWCERRPRLAAVLKVMRGMGLDPWLLVQALSLALRGRLPTALRPPEKAPDTLRTGATLLVVLLGALTLSGCATTFEEARLAGAPAAAPAAPSPADVAYCRELDSSRTTWGAVAKGSAALAGASGLATLPVDSERGRLALGGATLAVGAVSVVAVYVSEAQGAAWVRDCSH